MNKPIRKYGIVVTYKAGGESTIWYFTEIQRNSSMFKLKSDPKVMKVQPKRKK